MNNALKHSGKPAYALGFAGCPLLLATLVFASGQTPPSHPDLSGQTINRCGENIATRLRNANRESLAPTVRKVAPAVVKIVTVVTLGNVAGAPGPASEDLSSQSMLGQLPRGSLHLPVLHGLGSGVIVTEDGYILTNQHIVEGAREIKVTLQDGRQFNGRIIGADAQSDLAVIKVDGTSLPTVQLAESRLVEVGDMVLAIGNPFGMGQTVTHGIVSATDRGRVGIQDYENFIQTDAPINPGNSGGALVDANGALIGINTAILSGTGGNQGIGFAIPSDLARRVMADLVTYGRVVRGYLGVDAQDLTPDLAAEFHIAPAVGALVGSVTRREPADKAGLKVGDVIS
jgi:S1-C subfamily serine protease